MDTRYPVPDTYSPMHTMRIIPSLRELAQAVTNILFPPLCVSCQEITRGGSPLCDRCRQSLTICGFFRLKRRGALTRGPARRQEMPEILFYSCYRYTQPLKEVLHHFKYHIHYRYLASFLTEIMLANLRPQQPLVRSYHLMTFVPMHAAKLREREFNHAHVLTQGLSAAWGIPIASGLLKVPRLYPLQSHLSAKDRILNPRDKFRLNPETTAAHSGKNIILVDDILTTGSTVASCAHALLPLRPKKMLVLTLAKA